MGKKRRIDMLDIECFREDIVRKFFEKVEKSDGCWMWTGVKSDKGYGVFSWSSCSAYAHRFSYMLHIGEIEKRTDAQGWCVCHRCDVPLCVNPDHLFLGTKKDNMQDMIQKRRAGWLKKQTS